MVVLTRDQRAAIFANRRGIKSNVDVPPVVLREGQLRLLLKRYGTGIGTDPDVVHSSNFDEAERRAQIINTYGLDAARAPKVLGSTSLNEARNEARHAIKKETGVRFVSPKRAEQQRKGEVAGQSGVTSEFDRIFKERLRQQVELEKKKREMIQNG